MEICEAYNLRQWTLEGFTVMANSKAMANKCIVVPYSLHEENVGGSRTAAVKKKARQMKEQIFSEREVSSGK